MTQSGERRKKTKRSRVGPPEQIDGPSFLTMEKNGESQKRKKSKRTAESISRLCEPTQLPIRAADPLENNTQAEQNPDLVGTQAQHVKKKKRKSKGPKNLQEEAGQLETGVAEPSRGQNGANELLTEDCGDVPLVNLTADHPSLIGGTDSPEESSQPDVAMENDHTHGMSTMEGSLDLGILKKSAPAKAAEGLGAVTSSDPRSQNGSSAVHHNHKDSGKNKAKQKASVPVLPWMRHPIKVEPDATISLDAVQGMHPQLRDALVKRKFIELFPVQVATWNILAGGYSQEHDVCICAPTGSGKTLAYVLPILQALTGRLGGILGALVVMPTRELAIQVFEVFKTLSPACGLRTAVLCAHNTLSAEIEALGQNPVNILVATPGRLMAHLDLERPSVTLSTIKFLVIDESDRLLRQAYQDWLPRVLDILSENVEQARRLGVEDFAMPRVTKMIVSATITQDPAKLDRIGLHHPRYITYVTSEQRYSVPKLLKEYRLIGAAVDKPVLLAAVLEDLESAKIIVFTSSLLSTHRLYVVLRELYGAQVAESSSTIGKGKDAISVTAFRSGKARILVASDAVSRGLDIPDVDLVINYDAPVYPKTYIHRAGRTARAGKEGKVITLLSSEQVHHFRGMLRKVDNSEVRDYVLPVGTVHSTRKRVQDALARAGELLEADD